MNIAYTGPRPGSILRARPRRRATFPCLFAGALFVALNTFANAAQTTTATPAAPATNANPARNINAAADEPSLPRADAAPATPGTRFEEDVSQWRFVGRLSLRATYDDNITIRPDNELDDMIFAIAPSLAFGIGNFRTAVAPYAAIPHFIARTGEEDLPRRDYAFASYTPEGLFFRDFDDENTVNHDVRFAARQERDLWNAQGEFRFQRVTDVDLDFGRRVRQTYYTAHAIGERSLTGKIRGSLGGHANRSEYAGGNTSTDVRGTTFLDYQIGPKTTLGLGGTAGYLMVERGADQTYQQPLVQIKYQPTAKISFAGQAGEEFRQYDSDIDDRSRFVFSLSGDYEASDATRFNVAARRETQSSAQYSGENVVATLYQAGVRQRFLQRVYVSLLGGHVRNEYENNVPTAILSRRDNFNFYKASSSLDVSRRGTVELSYEHRENDSTLPNFEFEQSLVTLAASFLF